MDLYEQAWRDLDHGYIIETGIDIRRGLEAADIVEVDYEPGDMTRYPLVFVPLEIVGRVGDKPAWPGVDYKTGVLVALGGGYGSCYAINLLGRHRQDYIHYSYVAENWMRRESNASAVALELLFERIADVDSIDPLADA